MLLMMVIAHQHLGKFSCLEIPATGRLKPENWPKIHRMIIIIIRRIKREKN